MLRALKCYKKVDMAVGKGNAKLVDGGLKMAAKMVGKMSTDEARAVIAEASAPLQHYLPAKRGFSVCSAWNNI